MPTLNTIELDTGTAWLLSNIIGPNNADNAPSLPLLGVLRTKFWPLLPSYTLEGIVDVKLSVILAQLVVFESK